jgi:S1-C subfamily serine protease
MAGKAPAFIIALLLFSSPATAQAPDARSLFEVDGLALGGRVQPDSREYQKYRCEPSEQYPGLTRCERSQTEQSRRGPYESSHSILHSPDGKVLYVNRYIEPAFWDGDEVSADIARLTKKFRKEPNIKRLPRVVPGSPDGVIATWGEVSLEPLDEASMELLSKGKSPGKGILVDFIGRFQRSAQQGLPVYRLAGGAGYVWIASFKNGRGTLRYFAVDAASLVTPPIVAQTPDDHEKIGWWSITYKQVGNVNVCSAAAQFQDKTYFEMALMQSAENANKLWLLFISNPKWNAWVGRKAKHNLWLVTNKPWQGTFSVTENKSLFFENVSIDFMNTVADADSLAIFNDDEQLLTELDMKDSAAAIKAVVNCVQEHPPPTVPAPEAETSSFGTAFFVAPNLLVTNNHVIKECKRAIQVRYPERASYSVTVFAQDETNDLALVHTDMSNNPSVASFRLQPRQGDAVATYGFPYPGILSPNFTLGNVTSLSGMRNDTRFLQMSTPIQPGNSGGPLLDMSGRVVGVVVAQLDAVAMMQGHGSVPQNVNFAIQAPIIINFLSIKGVAANLDSSAATRTLSPSDVADMAKQFTVQIYCIAGSPTAANEIPVLASKFKTATPPESAATSHRLSKVAPRRLLSGNWQKLNGGAR